MESEETIAIRTTGKNTVEKHTVIPTTAPQAHLSSRLFFFAASLASDTVRACLPSPSGASSSRCRSGVAVAMPYSILKGAIGAYGDVG